MLKSVSIILNITRQSSHIYKTLALQSQNADWIEFVIIINKNQPDLLNWLTKKAEISGQKVEFVYCDKNTNSAQQKNLAIKKAKGDLLLFLHEEVVPDRKMIDVHLQELAMSDFVGAAGAVEYTLNHARRLENALYISGFLERFYLPDYYPDHSWASFDHISLIRKEIEGIEFRNIFPENGFSEDVDFCWKLSQHTGKKIKMCSQTLALHPQWKKRSGLFDWIKKIARSEPVLVKNYPERRIRQWPDFWVFSFVFYFIVVLSSIFVSPLLLLQIPVHLGLLMTLKAGIMARFINSDWSTALLLDVLNLHYAYCYNQTVMRNGWFSFLFNRLQYMDEGKKDNQDYGRLSDILLNQKLYYKLSGILFLVTWGMTCIPLLIILK